MSENNIFLENGVHKSTEEEKYVVPNDQSIIKALENFRDLKLGFMMHWSPATQLGLTESWPLSDGDMDWSAKEIFWTNDREEFKNQYFETATTFNPIKFSPELYAKIAKECGFKYLLFTTKHHDGFCMWDTKTTDYKITNPNFPFSKNKNSDIVKRLFDSFRNEGLGISAYFSKADWHSNYYWADSESKFKTRNTNYDPAEKPELWEKFVNFTHKQIRELIYDYGKVDVLWLDGGWVRPEVLSQDLRFNELVPELREKYPELLIADRTVGGEFENILTPEQSIPDHEIHVPWETCLTMGNSFSFHYEEVYKSTKTLVHNFIDIISKGGNLALNITPQPDGALPLEGLHKLRQFGYWVNQNSDAIYKTRISKIKQTTGYNLRYTAKENKDYVFFLYEDYPYLPRKIYINTKLPLKSVRHLRTNQAVNFEQIDDTRAILYTENISLLGAEYAESFELNY